MQYTQYELTVILVNHWDIIEDNHSMLLLLFKNQAANTPIQVTVEALARCPASGQRIGL